MATPTRISLALALLLAPLGCDDGDMDEEAVPTERGCATETRADSYALGMTKQGARVQVAFVDAMPAPPSRGDNTWRLAFTDAAGVALEDLAIEVEPYMPDHMHGSSIEAQVSASDVAGEYVIEPVNLFMPGLWQVRLYVELPDGDSDEVGFDFCIDP
ncbi:MAG: FixH family protein [Deltaproteobacteria bacterium]|nr:FixH family protein [Nannocystaceae bacterium]